MRITLLFVFSLISSGLSLAQSQAITVQNAVLCPAPIQTLSQRLKYRSTPEKSGNRPCSRGRSNFSGTRFTGRETRIYWVKQSPNSRIPVLVTRYTLAPLL
jgi:hypothetical protein